MQTYKGIKVGDLIKTYHKGYFELSRIEEQGATPPLFWYVPRYREDGTPLKTRTEKVCDASYCRLASDEIKSAIESHTLAISKLKKIWAAHCKD